jgi:hypothetical protein
MDEYQLAGHHVRILWKDSPTKSNNKSENTIFRGQVYQKDESGLWLWGRFFLEKVDTISLREIPRDKEGENKLYFAPWTSIESVQVILEGTRDHEIHLLILSRRSEAMKSTASRS